MSNTDQSDSGAPLGEVVEALKDAHRLVDELNALVAEAKGELEPRVASVEDDVVAAFENRMQSLDDHELVGVVFGMLTAPPEAWGRYLMLGATSAHAAAATRVAFTELAERWIPLDVFNAAVDWIGIGDDAC